MAWKSAAGGFFFDTRNDNAGRVSTIEHWRDDDPTWFTACTYGYDRTDRITQQWTEYDTSISAFTALATHNEVFVFDDPGQLLTKV